MWRWPSWPWQVQTAQAVQVPDEPEEGSEGALTVGFRLPSGGRLLRRFHKADTVSALAAFVAHHLATQGELGARQHVELSTQFPAKIFSHDMQDRLEAVGIEDRSMLNVAVKS